LQCASTIPQGTAPSNANAYIAWLSCATLGSQDPLASILHRAPYTTKSHNAGGPARLIVRAGLAPQAAACGEDRTGRKLRKTLKAWY
jgi:hypothetical protein